MTAAEYRALGLPVSLQIDEKAIERAEALIIASYIVPIVGTYDEQDDIQKRALAELVSLFLQQQNEKATRAGGKIKTTLQSQNADPWDLQARYACDAVLLALRAESGANADAKVNDVCNVYFSTCYFNL